MIEDAANDDPVQLQKGFTAYDYCSAISIIFIRTLEVAYILLGNFIACIEYDDECVTASETYSCGRQKEPGIVDVIFNTEKGNATIERNLGLMISVLAKYYIIWLPVRSSNSMYHADSSNSMPVYKKCTALCT
jgi:hypothetical protein